MKKIIPILFCAVLSACTDFSDDMREKTSSASDKLAEKIVLYEYEDGETSSKIWNFTYDEKNRVKTVTEEDDVVLYNYSYEEDKMLESMTTSYGVYYTTFDFADGRLIEITTTYSGGYTNHEILEYDDKEAKPTKLKGVSHDYYYKWDNSGNLVEILYTYNDSPYYYTYSNVKNKCNIDFLSIFVDYGVGGNMDFLDRNLFDCFVSPNLPSAETDSQGNIEMKFSYKYDKDGYVTEAKIEDQEDSDCYYIFQIYYRTENKEEDKDNLI